MTSISSFRASVDALVFDAYGTVFDVHSVASLAEALVPSKGATLTALWRTKQLEYTWLQGLMSTGSFVRQDFAAVTALALDYALEAVDADLDAASKRRLIDAYRTLTPFSDALPALDALAAVPKIILSNGTQAMLDALLAATGLAERFEAVLSVDAADAYKPSPDVYRLATTHLRLPASRLGFVSSNGWDAIGAKAFGFTSFWINRQRAPVDRHGPAPDVMLNSLAELPTFLAR